MVFKEAFTYMKSGKKITLPEWGGYWYIEDNEIMIHCKDGEQLKLRDSINIVQSIEFMTRDDWRLYVDIPPNNVTLDFDKSMQYVDLGYKVSQISWINSRADFDPYIVYLDMKMKVRMVEKHGLGLKDIYMPSEEDLTSNEWIILDRIKFGEIK